MQRKKLKCMHFILTLVSIFAVSVKSDEIFAIMGRDTSMPCYDPTMASGYESLFVDVVFTPPPTSPPKQPFSVCQYQPGNQALGTVHGSYQGRVGFTSVGALTLSSVSLTDEGVYTCRPNAFGLVPSSVETNLTVYVTPTVEVRKIEDPLLSGSGELQAAACTASNGKPPASVEWTTDRNLLFNESTSNIATSSQAQAETVEKVLHIRPTKFYNGKSFFCVVKHPAFEESVNRVVVLNVTYPPEKAVVIVNNDRNGLTCESEGNPPPTITWLMPPIAPTSTFRGKTVMLISPQDPSRSNDSYTCVASNGISPNQRTTVTTAFAVTYVEMTQQSNVGAIVGGVIGGLALLAIIVLLVYVFLLKPSREKDTGPYQYSGTSMIYKENSGGPRPTIEHANESLNRNRPPSPSGPPPEDKMDRSDTSSESDSDEGNHDVDVEVNPATNLVDPDRQDNAEIGGIVSRASVNFQPYWRHSVCENRRKRPSTSPAHRQSRSENNMPRKEESPVPNPRQNVRYDTPPGNDYDDDDQLIQDERYQGYPSEEYDDRYQPQYVGYPAGRQPPRRMDSLPQHEPKYTEIDHTGYQGGHRRPQFEEPVEYAQIRHGYSHVV
uniref:Nectin-1 n=1 Tax=Phallusia mammillata TaxID=59560 RepID=A0A6F9DPG0_9ASCI|nr:nectin-1 [Phallusia mammillata]